MLVKESPEYVKTSLAGAISLGMENGRFLRDIKCTCLNLLLTYEAGCKAKCSYCGLSGNRKLQNKPTFIRVKWPTYLLEDILTALKEKRHYFERICVSMTTNHQAIKDTCTIIKECTINSNLPVSALISPTVMKGTKDMLALKAAGTERIGVAVDAATEKLFDRHRGTGVKGPHRWKRYWEALAEGVDVFGRYMVGIHLIVGLGETEQEMVQVIDKAHQMGVLTHLFSFFPEAGSKMADAAQPSLESYRRVQLARFLINEGIIDAAQITYDHQGVINGYGIEIEKYLSEGIAFMTSGCPGADGLVACNRPFGNERASAPMRNYPFIPEPEDIALIRTQLWI